MPGFENTPAYTVLAELFYSKTLHDAEPASTHLFGFPSRSDRAYRANISIGEGSPRHHEVSARFPDAEPKGWLTDSGFLLVPSGDSWTDPIRVPPIGPRIHLGEDGPIQRMQPPKAVPSRPLPNGGSLRLVFDRRTLEYN